MMDTTATEEEVETTDKPEKVSDDQMDTDEVQSSTKKNKKLESIPILEPLPEGSIEGHAFSFVNELKLSDFKLVLSRNNIASEFQGGVLFCGGGMVALRRHDSGRVTIEGCVCDEYYQVRDLLYEQYAIV
jgi:cleavage and polyadenylation specificity factor subunit 2